MSNLLAEVIESLNDEFKDQMSPASRFYKEVDIGKRAEQLGFPSAGNTSHMVHAIIPLRRPVSGMKVRIDGRTFVDYAQYQSGVVVPGYVARKAGLPFETFIPNDSMILNYN